MKMQTGDYREQLEALNREFADLLPGRLEEIDRLWGALAAGWEGDRLRELTRRVHVLSGSSSTFGYPEVGRAAIALEKCLKSWFELADVPTAEALQHASALVAALRRGAEGRPSAPRVESLGSAPGEGGRLVFLVEDDESLAKELRLQLSSFGYQIEVFSDRSGVAAALAERRPDAVVLDIMLPEGDFAGIDLLEELRQQTDLEELPVLFVTARSDIEARLAAVRCGGAAYFVKPLDAMALVDQLNRLTQAHGAEPFRILIVDDDSTLAEHYALVLRRGGMQASVLTRPLEILDVLGEELPELVLMDINMPHCSGPELVQVIRQFDRFVSVPIVYLSTETDLERQLSALRIGGDDFLTKPLTDRHLFAAVAIRAERSRVLQALMTRDSLTGLLTHVALKERLATELARTWRVGSSLSFAMIDLDGFKRVNDRYGHLFGDRVLKSLADLLLQRFRSSDTIGRYGGEEFGVILPDCRLRDAVPAIEELRVGFAGIRFRSGPDELRVGFSAGVAAAAPGTSVDRLIDQADRALYQAKSDGGGRVVSAGE